MLIACVSRYSHEVLSGVFGSAIVVERFHEVAEGGALRAAARLRALLQLVLEIGLAVRAHDHDREILVVIDPGDRVAGLEHVLVEQVAERQIVRVIVDRHHRDDLLGVEVERQRPLDDDARLDRLAALVDAGDAFGEVRIVRVRADEKAGALLVHGRSVAERPRAREGPGTVGRGRLSTIRFAGIRRRSSRSAPSPAASRPGGGYRCRRRGRGH